MPKLNVNISHHLPQEEALRRVKSLLASLHNEKKDIVKLVYENWTGSEADFALHARNLELNGHIIVSEKYILINGQLPFLLTAHKATITEEIKTRITELLHPS